MTTETKTPRPHHATVARAALFGCVVEYVPTTNERNGGWQLTYTTEDNGILRSRDTYDTAREACGLLADADPADDSWIEQIEWVQDGIDDDQNGEDEEHKTSKCGVMDAGKHDQYEHNPHGPGCNDTIDMALRDAYTSEAKGLDIEGLRECAGSLWNPAYEALNNGMKRMNVANKLRGYLRNHELAEITIGGTTGRFGVAFQPPKRKEAKLAKLAKS